MQKQAIPHTAVHTTEMVESTHHNKSMENLQLANIPPLHEFLPFDCDMDEDEILKRYESAFRSFINFNTFTELKKPITSADVGKTIQDSLVDFCVSHALQGNTYIEEIQMNLQYTVLQSALILTISMPLYIETPDFNATNITRAFSAIIGLAAFCQLAVIIGCTIVSALLNRPYTPADTMVARVQSNSLMIFVNVVNYVANFATMAAMLIAGFDRAKVDGAVQMYVGFLIFFLSFIAWKATQKGADFQDRRVLAFYEKYCDVSGRLKTEYLARVYNNTNNEADAVAK